MSSSDSPPIAAALFAENSELGISRLENDLHVLTVEFYNRWLKGR